MNALLLSAMLIVTMPSDRGPEVAALLFRGCGYLGPCWVRGEMFPRGRVFVDARVAASGQSVTFHVPPGRYQVRFRSTDPGPLSGAVWVDVSSYRRPCGVCHD